MPDIERGNTKSLLINEEGVRCLGFGPAARREEGEYPWWIFDRRATPPPGQRPATLPAGGFLAGVWRRCSSVIPKAFGTDHAPLPVRKHSRLARRPPESRAPIPHLLTGFKAKSWLRTMILAKPLTN
jgi:hypothetical protein